MKVNDPRHGTLAGHAAGCRDTCCGDAKRRYDKRRKWEALQGLARLVPSLGTRRRVRALQALGYSVPAIASEASLPAKTVLDLCYRSDRVRAETANAIAATYERLCMTPATGPYSNRSRLCAQRKGWAPPLAWDDIDNPDERPSRPGSRSHHRPHTWIDPVVVERVLAGDTTVHASKAERTEVCRRWVESGRSLKSLEALTGWAAVQYFHLSDEQAVA